MFRLARETKLDVTTVARAEASDGEPSITMAQAAKIEGALEAVGLRAGAYADTAPMDSLTRSSAEQFAASAAII